jgi:hypothetical protein
MRTPGLSLVLLTSALLLPGCDATIVLGTECPLLRGACPKPDASAAEDAGLVGSLDADGNPRNDAADDEDDDAAAQPEAGPSEPDGQAQPDAEADAETEVDAGPGLLPELQNPSFELSDGGSEAGNLTAFEMPSPIAPWYACRTGLSVANSARAGAVSVEPTDGASFLGDSFPIVALNLNGLNQDLTPPLKAGQRYAFVVDLWSEGGITSTLELHVVNGASCLPTVARLASSGPLPNGAWQRRCITFTPGRDVATLGLMVSAPEEYLNIGARLYVDNIRSEPDCQ